MYEHRRAVNRAADDTLHGPVRLPVGRQHPTLCIDKLDDPTVDTARGHVVGLVDEPDALPLFDQSAQVF